MNKIAGKVIGNTTSTPISPPDLSAYALKEELSNVEEIALGKNKAYIFNSESEAAEWALEHPENQSKLIAGDLLLSKNSEDNNFFWNGEWICYLNYPVENMVTHGYINNVYNTVFTEMEKYAEKTHIQKYGDVSGGFLFSFLSNHLKDLRIGESEEGIFFSFEDGEYPDDYTSGLSFYSGETPTPLSYSGSGILNWVGTDCSVSDGLSIFQPSANKQYDIVFYYNGTQFIGLVNGYVPATGNVVSE